MARRLLPFHTSVRLRDNEACHAPHKNDIVIGGNVAATPFKYTAIRRTSPMEVVGITVGYHIDSDTTCQNAQNAPKSHLDANNARQSTKNGKICTILTNI